jgi:hypothetical protein
MSVPKEIISLIEKKAEADWPGDSSMQAQAIQAQREAYEKFTHYETIFELTTETNAECFRKAKIDWPEDFVMQVHTFESQIKSAIQFFEYQNEAIPQTILDELRNNAFGEWPGDYERMLHSLTAQVATWLEQNS